MNDAQQMHSSITPHFFKVVSQDTLREKKIHIPRKFVRKHGGTLTSPITLQLPRGLEWEIDLEKRGGEIWLKKGWLEFAKHHSIEQSHFLVFRYEGNSHFHVIIFDKSAVEIDYPINPTHFNESDIGKDKLVEPKREEMEYDDCIEMGDKNSVFPKTGDKSSFQYSRPRKRMRTNDKMSTHLSNPKSNVIGRKQRLSYPERAKANEKAVSGFKSENPFFSVVMQPSYVFTGGHNLKIPEKFAERYMNKKGGELTLGISDGRSWPIQYKTKNRSEIINRGWKAFAGDNNLEVGDVCIFELIPGGNKISHFQVSIVRHADQITPGKFEEKSSGGNGSRSGSGKGSERPPISSGGSASKYPSFQVLLPASSLHCLLFIPSSFARSKFENKRRQEVELKMGKKKWDMKLIKTSGARFFLTREWIGFAKDNRLRVGDVCSFEMIQKKPVVLQVSITRTN